MIGDIFTVWVGDTRFVKGSLSASNMGKNHTWHKTPEGLDVFTAPSADGNGTGDGLVHGGDWGDGAHGASSGHGWGADHGLET